MIKNISRLHLDLLEPKARYIFLNLVKIEADGVLGGGTATMLILAHRLSFDLDIFIPKPIKKKLLLNLKKFYEEELERPIVDSSDELSTVISNTKVSFIFFPFRALHPTLKTESIDLFSPPDLASNKAYVIGRRGAWRD